MANGGWYGTREEWNRVEAPFKLLDPELDRFAREHGLRVTRNHKDWPERSIAWGSEVRCLIQVFLVDQSKRTLNLSLCASQDRNDSRFWKQEMLRQEVPISELSADFFALLEAGKRKLDDWSSRAEILEFAAKIGPSHD